MKKQILLCVLLLYSFSLFAQENEIAQTEQNEFTYRIENVSYAITGKTKEAALRQAFPIDMSSFFSKKELETYLQHIENQLKNNRIFFSATVSKTEYAPDEQKRILVDVNIKVTDTSNFIIFPYPKYDSNSGIEIKTKMKSSNFAGSMKPFELDFAYIYNDRINQHGLSGEIDFSYPLSYTTIASKMFLDGIIEWGIPKNLIADIRTGVDFSYSYALGSIDFGFTQGLTYNPDYKETNDELHFTEFFYFRTPLILAHIYNWTELYWKPGIYLEWIFSPDIRKDFGSSGITRPDLRGPRIAFYHTISFEKIDWIDNFRKGIKIEFYQDYSYNFHSQFRRGAHFERFNTLLKVEVQGFYAFSHAGINARAQFIYNLQDYTQTKIGTYVRGIPDYKAGRGEKYYAFQHGIIFNFDFPIKIIQTDWAEWNFPHWLSMFDFELQFSPIIDIAFGYSNTPGQEFSYNWKDGFYTAGFEILIFPLRMRSLQARASIAFDLTSLATETYINKKFRFNSTLEAYIGIGLSY